MSEFRKDPVTNRWIIISPEFRNRMNIPEKLEEVNSGPIPENCPFCPGHEDKTPPEIIAYRKGGEKNGPGWWVRVIPNKFPALMIEPPLKRRGIGMYDMMNGVGAHEVIIETPNHYMSLGKMTEKEVEDVLWAYYDRFTDLQKDPRMEYILIFKNHKREAGSSLEHPHSQIIATPIVPKRVMEEMKWAKKYYDYKKRCMFCDILTQEKEDGRRVIFENDHFITFAPFAPRFPYEMHIMPKEHQPSFGMIKPSEMPHLASALRDALRRIYLLLNDPPYNFIIHSSLQSRKDVSESYHWHIEIVPRLIKMTGFEWGSGFHINPIYPEEAASQLREVNVT